MAVVVHDRIVNASKPLPDRSPVGTDEVPRIKQIVLLNIQTAATIGRLRATPYLGSVLVFWAGNDGEQEAHAYAQSLAEEDSGLADLILGFAGPSSHAADGSMPIDTKTLSNWITLGNQELAQRCRDG